MHQLVAQSSKASHYKPGQKIQPLKPTLIAKPPPAASIYFLFIMQEKNLILFPVFTALTPQSNARKISHAISSIHSSESPKLKHLPVGSPRQNLELNPSLLLSKAWEITAQSNKSTHEQQAGCVTELIRQSRHPSPCQELLSVYLGSPKRDRGCCSPRFGGISSKTNGSDL